MKKLNKFAFRKAYLSLLETKLEEKVWMTCRWQLCLMVHQIISNITAAYHNLFLHISHT